MKANRLLPPLLLSLFTLDHLGLANDGYLGTEDEQSSYQEDDSNDSPGTIGISGGVGLGAGYFRADLTVSYGFNPYVGIDTSGFYFTLTDDKSKSIAYGPEVALVLRLPNPTMVTPFVGAGPGFRVWKRTYDDEPFDESSSATGNWFVGADIALTDNFGLQGVYKSTTYLGDPPIDFDDRKTPEEKTFTRVIIGFRVHIST